MTTSASPFEETNQPPPLESVNLFASDAALKEAVEREGGAAAAAQLERFGILAGSAEAMDRARLADENPPRLMTHDRFGHRIDRVDLHPAFHAAMAMSCAEGLHSSVWLGRTKTGAEPAFGAHVVRAAGLYMASEMESGHCQALLVANASVAALAKSPAVAKSWMPKVLARDYDPRNLPATARKSCALTGVAIAERQAGTDLKAIATHATRVDGVRYVLTGHKWFVSAPMSDAFVVLARAPDGISCFLAPRLLPEGTLNGVTIARLKTQLGNRSSPTAEIELAGAEAWLLGEQGQGAAIAAEMTEHCRLDHSVISTGLMRLALRHAVHHARNRSVSGRRLSDAPLMTQVLADIALDVEAAIALTFRLARAFDRATDERAAAWRRLMVPVTKYWVCKVAQIAAAEAMECLGGDGYVEDLPLARIVRDLPLHAIADGPGSVLALDVLNVLQREPEGVRLVLDDLAHAASGDPALQAAHAHIEAILQEPRWLDQRARMLVEKLAALAAGTILRAHAPPAVADAFLATRLVHVSGRTYGRGLDTATATAIIERVTLAVP